MGFRRRKGEHFAYKLVVAVRSDLNLSCGKLSAQVGHAAVNCALQAKERNRDWFRAWDREGAKKVVVKAPDLEELHELKEHAEHFKLPHSLITDAGLTQVPPGTVTCLGIGPAPDELVDKVTRHLSLM